MNIVPHLTGKADAVPHERLFWKSNNQGAIREGRYKLLTAKDGKMRELYDLEADLGETKNLAAEKPELVRRLDAAWQSWNAGMAPPLWMMPPESTWTKPKYQPPLKPGE